MIDHLKTTRTIAMEAAANCSDNIDLELIGTTALRDHSDLLKQGVDCGTLNNSLTIKNVIGLNTNFCYVIEAVTNNKVVSYERGIAYAYEQDNKVFLKRHLPLIQGKNKLESLPSYNNQCFPFKCCGDCHVAVYSSIPQSYLECLLVPNSVLTSCEDSLPNPTQLKNNSILARLDQNIESVSFDDDRLIDKFINIISKFTRQLKLKTTKLSLKRIEPEVIDMAPSHNVKAKKGSIYYDEYDNTLKVYNGQSWKTLAFIEE